jgi:hypothetical protein
VRVPVKMVTECSVFYGSLASENRTALPWTG